MAIISSYTPDINPSNEDILLGSNYTGTVNGVKQYETASYTLESLAQWFGTNVSVGDEVYNIADMSTKIDNLQDMFTYDNVLEDATGLSTTLTDFLDDWVDDKGFTTDAVPTDTDGLDEGATNFYYTENRFDTSLGTKTTDDLDEGDNNLYFTRARVQDVLSEGTGIDLTWDGTNLQVASTITQYTDADAQGAFTEGTGIDITDGVISATGGGDAHDSLAFVVATFGSPANEETFDGVTYNYIDFAHNLAKYPAVTVVEESNPDRVCFVPVKYVDNNTVRVYFRGTTSGTIYVN